MIGDTGDGLLFLDGKLADETAYLKLSASVAQFEAKLEAAARAGRDVAGSDIAKPTTDWDLLAAAIVGPLEAGVEFSELLVMDWYSQVRTDEEAFVTEGMGNFVRAFGRALPVRLSTEVRRVRWVAGGVSVETPVAYPWKQMSARSMRRQR